MGKASANQSKREEFEVKLHNLPKACVAVEKLLYGELANSTLRAVAKPDVASHKERLSRMTAVFEIDCIELARILACRSTFSLALKPVAEAAHWLLQKDLPPTLQNPYGSNAIQEAVKSQNAEFFRALGRAIEDFPKRKPASAKDNLDELRSSLCCWWKPCCEWPGLAYCKLAARCDFLTILEKRGALSYPFTRKISPKNLDGIRKKLGLEPAKSPFISSIKCLGSSVRFS